jgi:hypothetical protein
MMGKWIKRTKIREKLTKNGKKRAKIKTKVLYSLFFVVFPSFLLFFYGFLTFPPV